ncbi:hypothetical protein [Marinilabilia salmonicolor]|uniref:hypothetical protein n=1 Tax=Marinilabilia salmonicolor TaxID=989 RepID=UPI00029AE62C|nr:hypothetical protein [Marinilabilia salmonicolor]
MKIVVCEGQIEVIERDNKEELELLTDKDVALHGVGTDLLKVNGGTFDTVAAYADTGKILDDYYKEHNSKRR